MTEFVRGTTLTPQQVYRPHFVYSAWDASGTCLYVGCTNNLTRRMREHDYASIPSILFWAVVLWLVFG